MKRNGIILMRFKLQFLARVNQLLREDNFPFRLWQCSLVGRVAGWHGTVCLGASNLGGDSQGFAHRCTQLNSLNHIIKFDRFII